MTALLFAAAFAIYNADQLRALKGMGRARKEVVVFTGVKDLHNVGDGESYNTMDPMHPMYKDMPPSINQASGAEYSYSMWLYINDTNCTEKGLKCALGSGKSLGNVADAGLTEFGNSEGASQTAPANKPFVLLLRGNKTPYAYKRLCAKNNDNKALKYDIMTKNPMIKLENGGDVLSVEINTIQSPDAVRARSRDVCDDVSEDWEHAQSYRIALKNLSMQPGTVVNRWFMVTVCVQDTTPMDPLPIRNNVRVRVYINGTKELDRYLDGRLDQGPGSATALRTNQGNLHVAPVIKLGDKRLTHDIEGNDRMYMADLSYFNYALADDEVTRRFNAGISRTFAPSVSLNANLDNTSFMANLSAGYKNNIMTELRMA